MQYQVWYITLATVTFLPIRCALNLIQSCLLAGYTENDPQPSSKLQESYILEEGEPSENFKEEEQEFLNKEMREEQVEVEEDSGKLQIMHTCTLLKWRC